MRVPEYLQDQGVDFETVLHPPAFTAQRQAHFLHVAGKELAKSVLLKGPKGDILAVLPATHQVDLEILAKALGGPVRLASECEVAKVFQDCEWGVRVPFGTLYGLPTPFDTSFSPDQFLVFEAHLHTVAIRMRCEDFESLERPRRLSFARYQD